MGIAELGRGPEGDTGGPTRKIMTTTIKANPGKRKRVGELLIDAGILTTEQLDEALTVQTQEGGKIVEILISLGHLDCDGVAEFLASQPGTPSIELSNYRIDPEMCALIPRDFAIKNEVFPVDKLGKLLTVGMAFPLDAITIGKLEEMTELRVKALLCRAQDIQNAIAQHYRVDETEEPESTETSAKLIETQARLESVAALLREIDALPTLAQTVERVQEAASSPETELAEIAAIVSEDPAISARILQLANTPAYGFSNTVTSMEFAATLLGLKEICMVVMSSAIIDLTEKSSNFDHEQFWRDSMFCATTAKRIAAMTTERKNHGVFTAALLCDIGRFALAEAAPARCKKIEKTMTGQELIETEESIFGIGHPEAGYVLASHWNLPAEISEPIRFHQSPQHAQEHPKLVAIVAIAARAAELRSAGESIDADGLASVVDCLQQLELTVEDAIAICDESALALL